MTRTLFAALVTTFVVACGRSTPTTVEPVHELRDEAPSFPEPEDDGAWEEVDPSEMGLEEVEPVDVDTPDIDPTELEPMDEAPQGVNDTGAGSQ